MMLATIFFLLSASVALWHLVTHLKAHLSASLLLFGGLLAIHGVPLLVYLHVTGPDTFIFESSLSGLDQDQILSRLLTAVGLMFLFITVGSLFAEVALAPWVRRGRRLAVFAQQSPLQKAYHLSIVEKTLIGCITAAMLAVSVEQQQLEKVLEYFTFDATAMERILLRIDTGGTPYYLYNVVLYSVAPFLVMVTLCDSLNRKLLGIWLPVILALAVLLGKFGTLSKAPPVIFVMQLLLLRALLLDRKLNVRRLLGLIVAIVFLLVLIVQFTIPDLGLSGIFSFLYYRVFDIPNEGLVEYFAAIPATLPHNWGVGIFGSIFDGAAAGRLPTYSAVAEIVRGNLMSTSNVMFIGDAWAEFSWAGVICFSLLAGALVRAIDIYALRNGYSDEWACLMSGASFGVFTMLSTALTTAMITGGLALIPLISIALTRRRRRPPVSRHGDALV